MSKLYYSEKGHVISTLCEELTEYRRARKILELPPTTSPASLYLLARSYPANPYPLRISINGNELPAVEPQAGAYLWYHISVPADYLIAGKNIFEFWNEAQAMCAWSLAMETGHSQPSSFVSTDGGKTWRNHQMGYLNVNRGEYLVRVRLVEGEDPLPPALVFEDENQQRFQKIRDILPSSVSRASSTLEKARLLATRISTSWEYRHSGMAAQYTPWDLETILSWGQSKNGHDNRLPIVMCVHYGVSMVTACQAAGIHARAAVFTGGINGFFGHFATEVWLPEFEKWVFVDPNIDAVFFDKHNPLSVKELQQLGNNLQPYVQWGPGYEFQMENPVMQEWIPGIFLQGLWMTHRSIWSRADFLSRPELTPPGHGATVYCETDLIWEEKDLLQGFGMFPFFAGQGYFEKPPENDGVAK